jgi:LysR family transcriptional regulator, glycine cleavage system transcriptional activator
MAYRLPPLNAVRQFEAVARRLSFRLAADELNVTPSAVSHGVQALEDWLGVPLFQRDRRGLTLTPAGLAYLPHVRDALDRLASATAALPRSWGGQLAISVAPSFAARWLLPNLHRFRRDHPEVDITIDTAHAHVEFPRDGIDVAIRRGIGNWPELQADCLFSEALVPVCAPDLATVIRTPDDLSEHTLLHATSVSEDWESWATASGARTLDVRRGLRFDTLDLLWNAASLGEGVAIGRVPLINPDLADRRLVPVLGPPTPSRTGYWLITTPSALKRAEVAAFRSWILEEAATLAGEDQRRTA